MKDGYPHYSVISKGDLTFFLKWYILFMQV